MHEATRVVLGHVDPWESCIYRLVQRDQLEVVHQRLERVGVGEGVRAGGRTPQSSEMAADPQRCTEVAGDRADVGAAGAGELDVQVHGRRIDPQPLQVQPRDGDPAGGQLNGLPRPGPGVGPPAVNLDRTHLRGDLVDLPPEGVEGISDQGLVKVSGAGRSQQPALGIIGVGGLAQPDGGAVDLAGQRQVAEQPGCLADADDEDAGGHRVEGPGVAHPPGAGQPAHTGDDIERGPAARLVHDHEPVRPVRRLSGRAHAVRCGAAASAAVTAATVAGTSS